ncbi:MAG: thermonuclease family protein [Candidatus Dadabacteria bacterium]|nr:thermonuclease family protein [Candidatus Dadabacteria bacterium]NIS09158.1 thermonuclease family protein [Candidatus Dadabacteria bacterium]NIY22465.1 hypothetical protein [Candidatus Dadabacteria bacterium]
MKKHQIVYLITTLVVVGSSYFFTNNQDFSEYEVLKVIDGDTVILDDGSETFLRYIGINSPEILTHESPGEPFSIEAKEFNEKLLGAKRVTLEFDREQYDHYGRMLAYVYADGIFINEQLVRNGLATTLKVKPNTKYYDRISAAEQEAKKNKRGIWSDRAGFNYPKENREFFIKPQSAERYLGKRVVTKGKVTDVRKSEKVIVLKLDEDLDIVIFANGWKNFSHFGINPETDFVGFAVEVIGRVKKYKGRPQIVVSHPITLKKLL